MSLVEIPLNGGGVALVDGSVAAVVGRFRWRRERRGTVLYAVRTVFHHDGFSRYMHKLLTGWPRTDHIDGDGLNNQRSNLRPADHRRNAQNGRVHSDNSTGYKGVLFDRRRSTWSARIRHNGSLGHLGTFHDPAEAARAYDAAARVAFGEFARLNFPVPGERSAR